MKFSDLPGTNTNSPSVLRRVAACLTKLIRGINEAFGQPEGFATLDEDGTLESEQMPDDIVCNSIDANSGTIDTLTVATNLRGGALTSTNLELMKAGGNARVGGDGGYGGLYFRGDQAKNNVIEPGSFISTGGGSLTLGAGFYNANYANIYDLTNQFIYYSYVGPNPATGNWLPAMRTQNAGQGDEPCVDLMPYEGVVWVHSYYADNREPVLCLNGSILFAMAAGSLPDAATSDGVFMPGDIEIGEVVEPVLWYNYGGVWYYWRADGWI
jgi:hypothetical protein